MKLMKFKANDALDVNSKLIWTQWVKRRVIELKENGKSIVSNKEVKLQNERKTNSNAKLTLIDEKKNLVGNEKPFMFCLSTNGKCILTHFLDSKRRYVAKPNSCAHGRFIKLSIASIDKREVKKKNGKYENISRNRPVMCRVPGCGHFDWRYYMDSHYAEKHENKVPPEELVLTQNELNTLSLNEFLMGSQFMKIHKKKPVIKGKAKAKGKGKRRREETNSKENGKQTKK